MNFVEDCARTALLACNRLTGAISGRKPSVIEAVNYFAPAGGYGAGFATRKHIEEAECQHRT
jgi:hypothetical protein